MKNITHSFILALLLCACGNKETTTTESPAPIDNSAPVVANAPADNPQSIEGSDELLAFEKEIEPIIAKAKASLPDAKTRFLKGLNKGEAFFLTINLKEEGKMERVFIRITEWNKENISGIITNEIMALKGYKLGQTVNFNEADVLDWTITKPDGTEEGNLIGKYLDNRGR